MGWILDKLLIRHVIPFLRDSQNVIDVKETTFLHDDAPCMSALQTQALLKANKVDFFGNNEWPGSSPDLNTYEHLGLIIKDRVEKKMVSNSKDDLQAALTRILGDTEFETQLFTSLLKFSGCIKLFIAI